MASGIVPGVLRSVGVLAVGTVGLAEAVLTTAVRGAVSVVQEAVEGVWTIGAEVIGRGGGAMRRREPSEERRDERRAA
jgi:hypothetical protein